MTFWQYLNHRDMRRAELRKLRRPTRVDARGWIGIGVFVLTVGVMVVMVIFPEIRTDEFFKTIATLIVGAYIKDVVGWAYQAGKGAGELALTNAEFIQNQARTNNEGSQA